MTRKLLLTILLVCTPQWVFARNLIVIRHGQALHNIQGVFNSTLRNASKSSLTEKGKAQVSKAAEDLKNTYHYDNSKVGAIFYSPFLRTKQTAEIIAKGLKVDPKKLVADDRLVEINMGRLEGHPEKELLNYVTPEEYEGESTQAVFERVKRFLAEIKKDPRPGDFILVTHGTPAVELIRALSGDEHVAEPQNAEIKVFSD